MLNDKWKKRFLVKAQEFAGWSKDRSTGVGCVIVDDDLNIRSTGYNGFPRKVNDDIDERHERPFKYMWTVHSEANAVSQAARTGVSINGCTAIVTHCPCSSCAKILIQAGIKEVWWGLVGTNGKMDPLEFEVAMTMFTEAGVKYGTI